MSESETADTSENSETDSEQPDVSFANAEAISSAVEQEHDRQAERHEGAREAHEDEKSILDAIQRDTVSVRLKGKPMEFKLFLGSTETYIENINEKFGPGGEYDEIDDPEELPDGVQAEFNDARTHIRDILDEHNVDEGKYNRPFWSDVPDKHCFEVIADIREGGMETEKAGN